MIHILSIVLKKVIRQITLSLSVLGFLNLFLCLPVSAINQLPSQGMAIDTPAQNEIGEPENSTDDPPVLMTVNIICLQFTLGVEDVCIIQPKNTPSQAIGLASLPEFTGDFLADVGSDWGNFAEYLNPSQICDSINWFSNFFNVSSEELANYGILEEGC